MIFHIQCRERERYRGKRMAILDDRNEKYTEQNT